MKYLNKLLSLTLIILLFSCGGSTDTPKDNTETPYFEPIVGYDETYIIEPGTSSGAIEMQYVSNVFTPNEEREVMLYGHDGNETWNFAHLEIDGRIFTNSIGRDINSHRDGDIFTVPIKVKANNFSTELAFPTKGNISIDGSGGPRNFSSPAQFVEIEKREFKVHYSCMNNCDVFGNLGNNTMDNTMRAFGEANTEFVKIDENLVLFEQVLDIQSFEDDPIVRRNEEVIKLRNKIQPLTGEDYLSWANNETWVLGCKDFISNSDLQLAYDISIYMKNNNNVLVGASFIFTSRGNYIGTQQPELEKQEITSRVIHELGHQRGRLLEDTFGYMPYGFVDDTHTKGHNGKNKGLCLMRVPGNPYDDQYTDVLFKKTIAEPHFCYGHIQMLYNCTFNEGGN